MTPALINGVSAPSKKIQCHCGSGSVTSRKLDRWRTVMICAAFARPNGSLAHAVVGVIQVGVFVCSSLVGAEDATTLQVVTSPTEVGYHCAGE